MICPILCDYLQNLYIERKCIIMVEEYAVFGVLFVIFYIQYSDI